MGLNKSIRQISAFQSLDDEIIDLLDATVVHRFFKKGEHLFFERQKVDCLYFLDAGCASLYKLDVHQDRRIIFVLKPGEWVNEVILDGKAASINCVFLVDSRVLCFEKTRFLEICRQHSILAKAVMDSMSLKIRRLYHQIRNTSNTTRGDKRIAAKLWKMARDCGVSCAEGTRIVPELSITMLAEMLGSKRETVSRQLKILADRRLILLEKRHFIVPDRDVLRDYFTKP